MQGNLTQLNSTGPMPKCSERVENRPTSEVGHYEQGFIKTLTCKMFLQLFHVIKACSRRTHCIVPQLTQLCDKRRHGKQQQNISPKHTNNLQCNKFTQTNFCTLQKTYSVWPKVSNQGTNFVHVLKVSAATSKHGYFWTSLSSYFSFMSTVIQYFSNKHALLTTCW